MINIKMIIPATLAVAFLFVGCATRQNAFEFGAGYDSHIDQGSNPQSSFTYRNEPKAGNGVVIEFQHNSSIKDGWPFNKNAEDLTNQWSVKYRFVF